MSYAREFSYTREFRHLCHGRWRLDDYVFAGLLFLACNAVVLAFADWALAETRTGMAQIVDRSYRPAAWTAGRRWYRTPEAYALVLTDAAGTYGVTVPASVYARHKAGDRLRVRKSFGRLTGYTWSVESY